MKKPEKKSEEKTNAKNLPKIFQKPLVYFVVASLILASLGVALLLIFSKPAVKTEWGNTYYGYIKDHAKNGGEDLGIIDGSESDMRFLELEGQDDPVMVISHHDDNHNPRANIYFIQNNTVNTLIYTQVTQVVFLYNISIQKYDYYLHVTMDGKDIYKSLSELLSETPEDTDAKTLNSDADYTFTKEDAETVKDENGEEIALSRYDQTFIEPEIENSAVPFNPDNITDKEIETAVVSAEESFRPVEEIVNEEVEAEVEQKVEEVKEKALTVEKIKEEQTLTNENVAKKLEPNLKWLFWFDTAKSQGSFFSSAYERKSLNPSVCQRLGLPKNKFDGSYNCSELVGAKSFADMKETGSRYLDSSVFSRMGGDKIIREDNYEAGGKVYYIFQGGGVGGAGLPYFDTKNLKVTSGEDGVYKVTWIIPRDTSVTSGNSVYKIYDLTVEYKDGNFIVTAI